MFRPILDCFVKVLDHADYAITLARLSVHDRIAGPMTEGPFGIADPGPMKHRAAELEPAPSPAEDLPPLGSAHDHIDEPAAALAAN
jgi:hypothetical protein